MFRDIADEIAFVLVENKIVENEKRDLYRYGAESLLLNLTIILIALVITFFTKTWGHLSVFIFLFVPLRISSGGYHAKTSRVCMGLSTIFYIITVVTIKVFPDLYKNIIAVATFIIASILIFIKTPIVNQNNVLNSKSYRYNKIISKIFIVLDFIIFVTLALFNIKAATSVMIFIILTGFLMILEIIKIKISNSKISKKGENYYE